jgi:hypothetical protein
MDILPLLILYVDIVWRRFSGFRFQVSALSLAVNVQSDHRKNLMKFHMAENFFAIKRSDLLATG